MRLSPTRPVTPHRTATPILTGHFREGPGYSSWRPSGTGDWLLLVTLGGRGRIGLSGGGERRTVAGDVVLLRPHCLHDYGTARDADGWELLWAHFLPRPHWHEWLAVWPDAAPSLCHFSLASASDRADVTRSLTAMHVHATGGRPRRDDFAMNALEESLLRCDHALFPHGEERLDPRVLRARTFLLEHLASPVSLAEAAAVADLSVSRLAHLFREQTGHTPQQLLEEERMARACQLLARTTRPVAAIAESVGYENPFYFSLRFKRRTGLSPRDWRNERQADGAGSW